MLYIYINKGSDILYYSHINLYWKDIDKKLMEYIDRYFEIRLGHVRDEEKSPLRKNEKGALQGYLQLFDDKNGKWINRISNICNRVLDIYNQKELKPSLEFIKFQQTICPDINIKNRIKIPLKAFYRATYQELLEINEPVIEYDSKGNIEKINIKPKQLKMAINLLALTGTLANRVAHSVSNIEESNDAYDYKHQMMTYLLIAVYNYNKLSEEKIKCKFSKTPSRSDYHSYPTFTIKLDDIGKVSLHFGGTLGSLDMLYDSLPEKIKLDSNFIQMLNIGSVGDLKCENIPRNAGND